MSLQAVVSAIFSKNPADALGFSRMVTRGGYFIMIIPAATAAFALLDDAPNHQGVINESLSSIVVSGLIPLMAAFARFVVFMRGFK